MVTVWAQSRSPGRKMSKIPSIKYFLFTITHRNSQKKGIMTNFNLKSATSLKSNIASLTIETFLREMSYVSKCNQRQSVIWSNGIHYTCQESHTDLISTSVYYLKPWNNSLYTRKYFTYNNSFSNTTTHLDLVITLILLYS